MGFVRKTLWLWCLAGFAVLGAGSNKKDAEVLAGIGHLLADRGHDWMDQFQQKWASLPGHLALESRIKNRLRWDKNLADTIIEVQVKENIVELKGNVSSQEQIRRAMDLAESTLGVEKVINSMKVETR